MQSLRLKLVLVVGAIAIAAWLLFDRAPSQTARQGEASEDMRAMRPTAIIERPQVVIYSNQGVAVHRFSGRQLSTRGDGRWLDIQHPEFQLGVAVGDQWQVESVHGLYDQQNQTFNLTGDVRMNRLGEGRPVAISADELEFNLQIDQVQSRSAVIVESPGHRMSSIGMLADLSTRRFEFLTEVRGFHEVD